MKRKRWATDEDAFLRANWECLRAEEVAESLDRSVSGVKDRAYKLNVPSKSITWSEDDDLYLKTNWGYVAGPYLAKHFGKTVGAIYARAHRLGLRSLFPKWSDSEKLFLASADGFIAINVIAAFLGRSVSSCLNKVFSLQHDPNYAISDQRLCDSYKLHSASLKARWKDPTYKKTMSDMSKTFWTDPAHRSMMLRRRNLLKEGDPEFLKRFYSGRKSRPTRPEKLLYQILEQEFSGEWIYNGNFEKGVTLGGLVPDFINVNGRKQIIELFGDYWHDKKKNIPWKSTEFGRRAIFSQLGYALLVIWEHELKSPEEVIEKIRRFNE